MWFRLAILCVLFASCEFASKETIKGDLAIIPRPAAMQVKEGYFVIDEETWIYPDSFPHPSFNPYKHFEALFFAKSGYQLNRVNQSKRNPDLDKIILVIKSPIPVPPDHYLMRITSTGIVIQASSEFGVYYALQTLRQMMRLDAYPDVNGTKRVWRVPLAVIEDHPAFRYRGMHLDVARHYMPVSFVEKYLDIMAYYKMNRFHWHLTDDQGWRIEIKKYPKLQEISAWRDQTLVGHYSDEPDVYDGRRYGGYYTQDEIREVVQYAKERGIMVIPEIEMPGHALAALAAYPELACTGGPFKVGETWGVFEDVFCTKEATFSFLEDVLDEIIPLFPAPYIHIGGDECPKSRWEKCPHCQYRMAEEGLHSGEELQSYFTKRIEKFLNDKGKQIIGWDEILEGGLAPKAVVMSWRGTEGGIAAARQNHDVIMTPGAFCYFDYYQGDPAYEPLAIGGSTTLSKVYSFDPIPRELNPEEARHILGAQGNLWTEYIDTPEKAEYMAFPRAIALAEVLWTPADKRNWPDFIKRLMEEEDRLNGLNVHFARSFYNPTAQKMSTPKGLKVIWNSVLADHPVFFTTDTTRNHWEKALPGDSTFFAQSSTVFYKTDRSHIFSFSFSPTRAAGAVIQALPSPDERYPGRQGAATLTDGLKGTTSFNGLDWCAWQGNPYRLMLSFANPVHADSIVLGFLVNAGSWIHAPKSIQVSGHDQNQKPFSLPLIRPEGWNNGRKDLVIPLQHLVLSDLYIDIQPISRIGPGLPGENQPAWTFMDEIAIY